MLKVVDYMKVEGVCQRFSLLVCCVIQCRVRYVVFVKVAEFRHAVNWKLEKLLCPCPLPVVSVPGVV